MDWLLELFSNYGGRRERPDQRARYNAVDGDANEVFRCFMGLGDTRCVQWYVRAPLIAPFKVPIGLAMSQEVDGRFGIMAASKHAGGARSTEGHGRT